MTLFRQLTVGAAILSASASAFAAGYPTKPVTLIVPYQAGGSTETMARAFAKQLSVDLKGHVIVQTRPGAGGKVGVTAASHARNDGYTLLFAPISTIIWPSITGKVTYSLKSFVPIVQLADYQQALVVSKESGIKNMDELLQKSHQSKLSYGDQTDLSRAFVNYIAKREKVDWLPVPTKGGGEMVPFLLGGKIDFAWSGGSHLRYPDDMNVLLSMNGKRLASSPNVPSIKEKYGVSMPAGSVLWAPANTPKEVINEIASAAAKTAQDKGFIDIVQNKMKFTMNFQRGDELKKTIDDAYHDLESVAKGNLQ